MNPKYIGDRYGSFRVSDIRFHPETLAMCFLEQGGKSIALLRADMMSATSQVSSATSRRTNHNHKQQASPRAYNQSCPLFVIDWNYMFRCPGDLGYREKLVEGGVGTLTHPSEQYLLRWPPFPDRKSRRAHAKTRPVSGAQSILEPTSNRRYLDGFTTGEVIATAQLLSCCTRREVIYIRVQHVHRPL